MAIREETVEWVDHDRAAVRIGRLTYTNLEETYAACSFGRVEPAELRAAPLTLERLREWYRNHLPASAARYGDFTRFNAAVLTVSPRPLPEGVVWFAGCTHDGFLLLVD